MARNTVRAWVRRGPDAERPRTGRPLALVGHEDWLKARFLAGVRNGHKGKIGTYFETLLRDAGLDPALAADLLLLFDGAVASAVREGSTAPAGRARRLAELLLNAAPPAP